jgi:hypothetical protein
MVGSKTALTPILELHRLPIARHAQELCTRRRIRFVAQSQGGEDLIAASTGRRRLKELDRADLLRK